jgi:hypothetical protein
VILALGRMKEGWRLPILDHQLKFFHQGIDFFQIFAASFLGSEIQCAAKGNHIAKITNLGGRQGGVFGLLKDGIPDLSQLSFDAFRVGVDGFAKRFSDEVEFLREGFHR